MTGADHHSFERHVSVRTLRQEDYDDLRRLTLRIYPNAEPWTSAQLASLLRVFPQGQFGVEWEGRIIATAFSMIIDFDMYRPELSWEEITDNGSITPHTPDGDTLYGVDIMVDPDYRGLKLARRLYEARKQLVRELNLMRIVIGGRIPNFARHSETMNVRTYVEQVVHKAIYDPVLTAQIANGFALKRIIKDYLKADRESEGYATLLEWTNLDYEPDKHRRILSTRLVRICVVQYQMRPIKAFIDFAHQCEYFVDSASAYRSDFVVFPEMVTLQLLSFMPAQRPGDAARAVSDFTPQYLELFTNLAIKHNVNIIGGSHFSVEDGRLYNVAYLFKRNGEIHKQYKLHITPSERKWWGVQPGEHVEVFDTDRGRISIQICYDVEFPEVSRIAVERGANIIFVPFCTDERHAYLRVRYCAQARCIENQVYTAIAGNVGNLPFVENMDVQYAQSAIFTPSDFPFARDAIAGECTPNVEMVVIQDVDIEMIRRQRREGTVMNWYDRRRDLYEVVEKKSPRP